jgi:flagellar hook-associated protein 1 FlgK
MPSVLTIGQSGLSAAKKQMATTAHNISNVNTEGFTRQRAEQQASRPIGTGNTVMGTGVDVTKIRRINDELIDKKLVNAQNDQSYHEERSFHLGQIEEIFNETNDEGLNKILNNFFNAFRDLSTQPDNETLKSVVRDKAELVIKDFHRVAERLEDTDASIKNRISMYSEDINSLMDNIKTLNIKVTELEIAGGETGDLRDQRDTAVKKLSEFFELSTSTNERGQYTVNAPGVGALVIGGHAQKIRGGIRNNDQGKAELYMYTENNPATNLVSHFNKGKIQGLHETYNKELTQSKKNLDYIAYNLAKSVNALHSKGYVNSAVINSVPSTGINFFNDLSQIEGACSALTLSSELKKDAGLICSSAEINTPGNNDIAVAISKLQHEKILAESTTSFEEEYLKQIGSIGLASGKSKVNLEQSKGILAQVQTIRDRISGVSLDEETSNMLQYQHAYEASARVIRASEEMFNSLLKMMGA